MEINEEIKKYDIKTLQNEMLILLKAFHSLCVENDINYSVHAGTMIGIVRERGFIPWDDDLDVSFTRREYDKLKKILNRRNLGEEFYFSEYDNSFPQLWMKRDGKPAVWIDFFIYDYITESRIGQKIKFFETALLLGILKNKRTMYLTKKRGAYTGIKYAFIYCGYLIGKFIPDEKKHVLADKLRKSHAGERKLIHRSNDRFSGIGFIYPEDVMKEYILMPFEDTELMITKRYDDILIPSYGDYMKPEKTMTEESGVHDAAREMLPGKNSGKV